MAGELSPSRSGAVPIHPMKRQSNKSSKPQVEEGARRPSERAALPHSNTQQSGADEEETSRAAKTGRQPELLVRKRHIDSGSDDDSERPPKRTPLTRRALALFNKMGKNKGKRALSTAPTESTTGSSTTRTTSTTTSGFAMQARRNGILDPLHSKSPAGLDDMRRRHAQSRCTASPTESAYEDYVKTVGVAPNEATMVFEVGERLLKKYPNEGYYRVFNQAFTGFPKDAGFNNGLSAPQPDFVEGLEMEEFRPIPIDNHVDGAILCKDDPNSVTLPHLAGEWKGRGKDMEEARLQSAFDGAALVYGRSQALNYIGKPGLAGDSRVTTFTTDGTTLNLFAHYVAPSENGTLEYHQYPISSTNLKSSHREFRQGFRQLRNAQDHAREESYRLRDQIREYWKAGESQPLPSHPPPSIEDEDGSIDQEPADEPPRPAGGRADYR